LKKIKTVEEILEEKRRNRIPVDKEMPPVPEVKIKLTLWEWLNYKKSYIGVGLIVFGKVSQGITALVFPPAVAISEAIFYAGCGMTGVGIGHKLIKGKKEAGSKGQKPWWEHLILILIAIAKQFAKKGGQ